MPFHSSIGFENKTNGTCSDIRERVEEGVEKEKEGEEEEAEADERLIALIPVGWIIHLRLFIQRREPDEVEN